MWRNKGIATGTEPDPATPEVGELGPISAPASDYSSLRSHNEMRGLHTVLQAQTITTLDTPSALLVLLA